MSDSQVSKRRPIRCRGRPAVYFAFSTNCRFRIHNKTFRSTAHSHTHIHSHTLILVKECRCHYLHHTPVCVTHSIFRINRDCSNVQNQQFLCIIEKQRVYCEAGNDISMPLERIPHQRSLFSSVTAIPPMSAAHLSTHV